MTQSTSHRPRILVLGSTGQLGLALQRQDAEGLEMLFAHRTEVELMEPVAVRDFVIGAKPDLVLNAAAYTDVDAAEADEDTALAVNAMAVEAIAQGASKAGAALLHISADYVFDGDLDRPYAETDHAAPINMYGATKLLGEELAQLSNPKTAILRTAGLFSEHRRNFVKTVLSAAETCEEISIVDDQFGNPTPASDLAVACVHVIRQLVDLDVYSDAWGVTHCAGLGSCSRADFASAILRKAGNTSCKVNPIQTTDWPTAAPRPRSTVLDCRRLTRIFGVTMPTWEADLERVLKVLALGSVEEVA